MPAARPISSSDVLTKPRSANMRMQTLTIDSRVSAAFLALADSAFALAVSVTASLTPSGGWHLLMPGGGLFVAAGDVQQVGFVEGAADQLEADRELLGGGRREPAGQA